MRNLITLLLLLCVSLGAGAQTVRQAVGANGTNTVSFPATVAGNLNVIVAVPGHYTSIAGVSATDSMGQAYKLAGSCGTPDGDGYVCVLYVCSGVGGVTSATVNGTDGGAAINFLEVQGTTSSNCLGATNTAAGTAAPCQISLAPDQPNELAVVGFATAGDAFTVNGNVTYSNQLDYGDDPVATTVTTSTATITAETDQGSPGCSITDDENPNGYNATFVAFRTQAPSSAACPATATVPANASCSYSQNLGSQAAESSSSTLTVNVSIAAGTTVGSIGVLTTGMAGIDFASATGSTCTASSYTTATSCGVNVKFTPQAAGLRRGAVVFYSGANNTGTVLATVPIYGIGTGPQVAYGPGGTQSNVGSGYSTPKGVAVDAAGNVYVADATAVVVDDPSPSPYSGSIYKLTTGGTRTTLGGPFAYPVAVAVDGAGNVYVADPNEAAVSKIPPVGTQTTIGSGFSSPSSVAVDGAGNVYVADTGNIAVYKITPGGAQTTVGSGFSQPASVAVDGAGNVYVADPGVPAVYKITPGGTQTTVGSSGISKPVAVAVDAAGSVYIFDQGSGTVYEVTPGGTESIVATGFGGQAAIAVDSSGNLYVADTSNVRVVKIDRADAPSLSFTSTDMGSTSSDSPKTVEIQNIGNATLTLSALSYPTDFPEATGDSNACTSTISLTPAEQCDLPIDFIPKSVASLSEDVTLTDNALNVAGAKQLIAVSGTGLSAGIAQTITFAPLPSPVTYGVGPITLSATGGASGKPVVFSVLSGPGSITGNTLTITGAGMVVVAANQAGNSTYAPAAQVTQTIVVTQAVQTINFTPPPSPVTYSGVTAASQPVFTLVQKCHPTSNASNTCTFPNNVKAGDLVIGGATIDNTIASTGVTDGAGHVFAFTPNSPCTGGSVASHSWLFYLLSSPGGANTNTVLFTDTDGPNPGDYVDDLWAYEFSVTGGTPAFDTDTNGCGSSTSNANPVATLTLAGSNELAYFNSLVVGGGVTGVGSPWTLGTLTQLDSVDGYDTTASSSITTSITPAGQGWGLVMAMAIRVIQPGTIALSATGGASGNAIAFSVVSGPGSVSGNILTITGAGTVVVAANQAGNANYAAAPQVTQSIKVNPASQAITFTPPASPVTYGVSPITLSATGGGSGNPVTFSVLSGPGSVSGSKLTITGAGTVVVAANQAGNTNYSAAPQVTQSIVVNQAPQTITFTAPTSPVTYGVSPITLSATGGGSGNPVTFSVLSGPGSVNGSALTITGDGTVVVAANQAGNANYTAAAQVTHSITVNTASQTITFTPPTSAVTYGVGAIALSATGGGSGNPITFSVLSGPGSVSGSKLTITGAGTVVVAANQAGNANYTAAAQVTQSITVAKAMLTVTANNASRLYLTANPTFTYAITGFVNQDTSSVVSGSATLTTTATASSTVGTYPITFSAESLTAANYTFSYVSGMLTIFDKSQTTIPSLTATTATINVFGFGFTAPSGQLAFTDTTTGNAVVAPVTLNTSTATTSLLPQVTTSTGANTLPVWTTLGDINGDGKLDLVTSLYLTDSVSVQLGNGDGTFQTATTILIAKGFGPAENHLVSLRGNGTLDLIVASFNTNQIAVLLGNGNGTFQTPVFYTVGSAANTPTSLTTGDFNDDGKLDVAVANTGDNTISVLLGNGSGSLTLQSPSISVGHDPEAIRAGDFNGDGYSDLAVANYNDGTVTTLLNNKNGTFTATTVSVGSGAGSGPQALAVNGSGSSLLLAVANYNDNTVSVLHSNGNGTFATQKIVSVGKGPDDVSFADFNGDGIPDLAVSNYSSGTTSLALGSSGGSYTVLGPFTVGSAPYSATVGDVDLDGTPDLVVSNCFSNNTGVLLSGDQISVPYTGFSLTAGHTLHAAYTPNGSSNYGSSTSASVTAP